MDIGTSVQFSIAFVALIVCFYLYMTRNLNHWQKKGAPHVKPYPIIGNFQDCFLLRRSIGEYVWDLYNQTKEDYLGFYVFDRPYILLRSPELIKSILIKDFSSFSDRSVANNHKVDPIGSRILFLLKNPEWRNTRLKMAPVFTSGKLKKMFGLINEVGEELQNYIRKFALSKDTVDAKEICAKYTTNVITSCAFGLNAHCFEDDNAHFRVIGRKVFGFNFIRGTQMNAYFFSPLAVKLLGLKFFDTSAAIYMKEVFLKTIEERKKTNAQRNDLIDTLIEIMKTKHTGTGPPLEGDILVAQAAQFFIAGFETTSSTICAALYELCLQPDLQSKLRTEITTVLAKHKEVNYESMSEMKYLKMVVSETLRMYPSLPHLDRRAVTDYTIPGTNVVIEKGTPVFIPLFGLHYDPEYYPNPMLFDPERFTEENIQNRVPFTYMPFGSGPHNCIGERFGLMSTKLGLIHILSHFVVERTAETPVPLKLNPKGFLITPVNGISMRFKEFATDAA